MSLIYRLLALDVDGTLVNSRNELPEANRAALHKAHEAGLTVCLCTGRSLTEARAVLDAIGLDLDAGVFVFGAIVTDLAAGRTIARAALARDIADRLATHFQARGYPLLVLYDASQAGVDYQFVYGDRNLDAYEQWLAVTPTRVERLQVWRPSPHDPVRIGVIDDPAHIAETVSLLEREFPPEKLKFNPIFAPNYRLHVVECFAPQVNKWYGISQLCRLWAIPHSEVVALGDDINDVEMIARAGLGVAMGNAIASVKAVARHQVRSHDECGVADLVEQLLARRVPAGR